jgi:hypothetical protein
MNEAVKQWLDDLERQRFYGSATLKIEAGRVTYIREERGMRPEELSRVKSRSSDHSSKQ